MMNDIRDLSDVEVDAVAGGLVLENVRITSVVRPETTVGDQSPTSHAPETTLTKDYDASSPY